MAISKTGPEAVTGTVTANAGTDLNTSGLLTTSNFDSKAGALTETAPATDTASSGINGRLQRIAQRITSLIALLPAALGANGGLKVEGVASGTVVPVSGTVTVGTVPAGSAKIGYGSSAAFTISLASLPSDTNLLAGQESAAVDNTTTKALDAMVAGRITVGTSPTDVRKIEVWGYASRNDTPTYPDVLDGTDSAEPITSLDIKYECMKLIAVMPTNNTSDRVYEFSLRSFCKCMELRYLPKFYGVFVVHNTGVNLHATAGNHVISYTPVWDLTA